MLDRESIRRGAVAEIIAEGEKLGLIKRTTAAERLASRRRMLASVTPGQDIWVFGYGSLMWNPAFEHVERRPGVIHGYHRSFCLWAPVGRGSPDNPGLLLGLDRGGSCCGVAFRIAAAQAEEELDIIWAREMVAHSYEPRWVTVRTAEDAHRAIAFVMNHDSKFYAGRLPEAIVARHIATAAGSLGPCADYLVNTVAHLDELGIRDGPLHALLERVRRLHISSEREERP